MKPISLHGHERSITQLKYNREGDLLFSCAKDQSPNVWYSINGERLGTFRGHGGAVWCLDVNWDTTKLVTGSADNTLKLWDVEYGKPFNEIKTLSAVRTVGWGYGGNTFFYTNDRTMGQKCALKVIDIRDPDQMDGDRPSLEETFEKSKVTSAVWGPLERVIITGHEDGSLRQIEVKSGETLHYVTEHTKQINDIQTDAHMSMFVTASKDFTSKLFDLDTMEHLKTYKTERPVNSAAISPIRKHVVLGGGQEAMDVTTTSTKVGKFDARFYHLVFEEEFGRVKGHFGPINTVQFHPDGQGYTSGGEDGYLRVHKFDSSYLDFEFEY